MVKSAAKVLKHDPLMNERTWRVEYNIRYYIDANPQTLI